MMMMEEIGTDKEADMGNNIGGDDTSLAKNFDFTIVSAWLGYNSANDPTMISNDIYVQGSLNMYKTLAGTIANRPGQLRIGAMNTTISEVSSEFIWNTSWGATYPVWVTNGTIQAYISGVWQTLMSTTLTRFVFDKWYDPTQAKDSLLFVGGDNNLYQWSGGVATITTGDNSVGHTSVISPIPTAGGSGYTVGDILTITTGGTGATVKVTSIGTGSILAASLAFGGTGLPSPGGYQQPYVAGNIYPVVSGNAGQNGAIQVTTVDGAGSITAFTIVSEGIGYVDQQLYYVYNGFPDTNLGTILVTSVGSSAVTGVQLLTSGVGYTTGTGKATSGGTGTGATLDILGIAQGSITASGAGTLQQDGFATNGTVVVGGTPYVYQYLVGNQFIGVTPDPTGITGIGLQQVVINVNLPISVSTTSQTSTFTNDFIKVINNQVYLGSYNSRLCFISSSSNYYNFIVPTPRITGDPEFLTLDSTLNGIGVKGGDAYISLGEGEWAQISFQQNVTSDSTYIEQTVVTVFPVAKQAAAYAHEFIGNAGDNIVYLAKDQQVRTIADYNNSFVNAYPSLSQQIATELSNEDFTGGGLKCIGDFTYVTAPVSGKTYLYQERQSVNDNNQVVVERLWHSPFTWNATRIDDYLGDVVAFSNANPQWYEVWTNQFHDDSPSGEPLPYTCIFASSYFTMGRRQGLFSFDKTFSEFYAALGTPLNLVLNYNYEGATNQITEVVNSATQPGYSFSASLASLGDSTLGDKILGDEINIDNTNNLELPKFKVINSVPLTNCIEFQMIYMTDQADAQFEMLAIGANVHVDPNAQATFLINKKPLSNT